MRNLFQSLPRPSRCSALCVVALALWCTATAADDGGPVEVGREMLRDRSYIPWYDAESDALQPVRLSEPWELDLRWLSEPITWFLMISLGLLVALLVWLVVYMWRQRERMKDGKKRLEADPLLVADRVEALPFLRDRSRGDLLAQARLYYEQGNYSEAIIYLFSYQLVELDRSSLIRLAKGKTNRQYLREALRVRPLAAMLERTMVTFEDVFFGRRMLDRGGFEACWNQLSEFKNILTSAQATA